MKIAIWHEVLVWGLGLATAAAHFVDRPQQVDEFPFLMPQVHPDSAESYLCTPIRLNTDETYYAVGFRPNATMKTAHHMLLFGCEEPGSQEPVWNCGEMTNKNPELITRPPCERGTQVIYAWAKDAPDLHLPKDVGFRVGGDSNVQYLVLQVHYASTEHIPAAGDNSGIFVQYTEQEQPKTAGVILLETGGYAPPHSTTYFEVACNVEDDREIHPFAFRTHAHALGKVISGWRVRNNRDWKLIGKQSPQKPQMFYPVDDKNIVLKKGDTLAARCTMVNFRDRNTYIGPTAEDEMCNFYMMYWVEGRDIVRPNTCFSYGPPSYSWASPYGGGLENIPEVEASTI